ncbi:hypothetical protein BBH88_06050 [Planococcus antarcticus DSM 14505]|uniref:NERD domain-containing protein n=1 Tax=Planococcus antarcticus DSM 14505 TaxID=1185653 RepID=A0ABN4RCT9_9BACL|nr:type II toxin-antitoxin system PemK/MazF family toxin [Planococcus antarcticus]ANU09890.1 hypothetical protein BBH88_06050 [Planococcus antarcticus DSM 14505]
MKRKIDIDFLIFLRKGLFRSPNEYEMKKARNIFLDLNSNLWNELYEKDRKNSFMFAESMNEFLLRKNDKAKFPPEIGDIVMLNLLLGYNHEASKIHPVLVLEKFGNRIFVVPGSSSDSYTKEAFHPSTNPTKKKNLYLIKPEEVILESGRTLEYNTGFKLENSALYSTSRITSDMAMAHLDPNSDAFKIIKAGVHYLIFPIENKFIEKTTIENNILKNDLIVLKEELSLVKIEKEMIEKNKKYEKN